MTAERPRYAADDIRRFVTDVFVRLDVPPEDARTGAETLVHADLLGIDSHGVAHVARHPGYVPGLRGGWVKARPDVRVLRETPSTVVLDGDGGLGVAVAPRAMARAIEKAAVNGCGFAAVRNGRHIGAAAHYSLMALGRGMIGIAMCNGPGTAMAPTFGREARLSTNPMSVAAPVGEGPPFMMDFGTSVVAGGKMELAMRDNRPVPAAWLRDKHGQPSTDPRDFWAGGTIPPLGGDAETGGYKGYALAVMVDIMSGVLSGTGYGGMLGLQVQGVFLGAWQVEAFLPLGDFTSTLDKALGTLRDTPPVDPRQRVLTPGEREWSTQEERSRLGIPLHPTVVEELREVGRELDVPFPSALRVTV